MSRWRRGGAGRKKISPTEFLICRGRVTKISSSPKGGQEDGGREGVYGEQQVSAYSRPVTIQSFNEQPHPQWLDEQPRKERTSPDGTPIHTVCAVLLYDIERSLISLRKGKNKCAKNLRKGWKNKKNTVSYLLALRPNRIFNFRSSSTMKHFLPKEKDAVTPCITSHLIVHARQSFFLSLQWGEDSGERDFIFAGS